MRREGELVEVHPGAERQPRYAADRRQQQPPRLAPAKGECEERAAHADRSPADHLPGRPGAL